MFYGELRKYGFRAYHVKEIYTYTKSIVEPAKNNGGKKPVLKRLTARIDKYDYSLDLNTMTLILKLKLHNNYEARLKLVTPIERLEKFMSYSNYELVVKYDGGRFWVIVHFKRTIKPVKPKTIMAIDVNFDNVTLAVFILSGILVKLKSFKTLLKKMLTHRIWIERIQKNTLDLGDLSKVLRELLKNMVRRSGVSLGIILIK